MDYIYIEGNEYEVGSIVHKKVLESTSIHDPSTHTKYIKIGAGIDIETSKIIISETEVTAYCYHWQFCLGDIAILGRSLDTMHEFMEILMNEMEETKPKQKLMVFDANLGYEWQFCKHYWSKFRITKTFAKEERDPIIIEVDYKLQMREVLGLFGNSLAQIAKNYCGIPKLIGDLNYDDIILSNTPMSEQEIKYCVRDVEILGKLAEDHIYKNYMGNNPKLALTSTGFIRDAIKREYGSGLKAQNELIESWMPESEDEYELFRRYLFKGGISGSNVKLAGKILKHVVGADITSDYPFQMLTKQFPMGAARVTSNKDFCKTNKPYIATIMFHKFRSRSQHALMSAHKALNSKEMIKCEDTILDNNRIQYADKVELILNDVEYRALKKAYKWDHAMVKKCWVFNEGYKMLPIEVRKVVLKQYLIKEELKHEHSDTQEYRDAKAFVNGIFGMMCTALYFEDICFLEDLCELGLKNGRKKYEDCIKKLFLSPYWGFWITSYAREMLMDVITRFPNIIIQYDTDSVYFVNEGEEAKKLYSYLQDRNKSYEKMNGILFQHNERMKSLGTWDIEKEFKRFKGLGSKRYMYEKQNGDIKITIAGCRKYKDENGKERSTMLDQLEYDNFINDTNIDPFDFFNEKMTIDKEHSRKLGSTYVDKSFEVDYTDRDGNVEHIVCPSALVLTPIPFTMTFGKMGNSHKTYGDLLVAVQRFMRNSSEGRMVYDIWRGLNGLRKSNT